MFHYRRYIIRAGRHGKLEVIVANATIELRGEREAVVSAAWRKLMGENDLGEVVHENLPTRKALLTEMLSRPESERMDVFWTFRANIKFHLVGNL